MNILTYACLNCLTLFIFVYKLYVLLEKIVNNSNLYFKFKYSIRRTLSQ